MLFDPLARDLAEKYNNQVTKELRIKYSIGGDDTWFFIKALPCFIELLLFFHITKHCMQESISNIEEILDKKLFLIEKKVLLSLETVLEAIEFLNM